MSLLIQNVDTANVVLNDLGITLVPAEQYDLTQERALTVAGSNDLPAAITAGTINVLDPLDDTTPLALAEAQAAVAAMNDSHYRIRGGTIQQLDNVILTSPIADDILRFNGTNFINAKGPVEGSGVREITAGQLAHLQGTTTIPYDDTPPAITEGTEFFAVTTTTESAVGRVVLWFSSIVTVSNANRTVTISIFRDNTLIGVTAVGAPNSNSPVTSTFIVQDDPGAAGTYTYSGRIGVSASATWYVGGFTDNANYGGAANTNNQFVLMRLE